MDGRWLAFRWWMDVQTDTPMVDLECGAYLIQLRIIHIVLGCVHFEDVGLSTAC